VPVGFEISEIAQKLQTPGAIIAVLKVSLKIELCLIKCVLIETWQSDRFQIHRRGTQTCTGAFHDNFADRGAGLVRGPHRGRGTGQSGGAVQNQAQER